MPSRRFRLVHSLSAGAIVFALAAGLACDENAPTESRVPTTPTAVAADASEADLAAGSISALSIALPVDQSVATVAPAPAFRVNQTSSGPNGIFQITNSANTQNALQGLTNGLGRAGFFRITNMASTSPALMAQTNSTRPAFQAVTGGSVSSFSVPPTASAGLFQVSNTSNRSPALWATSVGPGPAGQFEQNSSNPQTAALEVACNGTNCRGFRVLNNGTGQAAFIMNTSATNSEPSLWVRRDGALLALYVTGNSEFHGDVNVSGTLTKPAGSFRIDDPRDPEHKYLSHSFVESPDMMNVYNGNAILDANGRATVELPAYFEALNRDFRYQLTAIGAPGPNLYISEGVKANRFRIAGGRAYAHVSWQVTGIRHDAYAEEHRIKVEEDKPAVKQQIVAQRGD